MRLVNDYDMKNKVGTTVLAQGKATLHHGRLHTSSLASTQHPFKTFSPLFSENGCQAANATNLNVVIFFLASERLTK